MILAIIPAKGGSKRLPNKNMHPINGRPLIDYTIEYVKNSKIINDFIVTTDDKIIKEYCIENNIKYVMRSQKLGGETPIIDVYRHALEKINFSFKVEILLGIQVDHPDRQLSADETIEIFKKEKADRLFSKEKDGTKNGAHYILSNYFLKNNVSRKDITIVDDCTNIHYIEDLKRAAENLKKNV